MAEPTKGAKLMSDTRLATQEEFETLLSSVARDHAYEAALTALHEAEQARDAALKRVAELETQATSWSVQAFVKALDERDALAAELRELREAVGELFSYLDDTKTDSIFGLGDLEDRLRRFAAQPQGERGKALLAVVEAARAQKMDPTLSQLGRALAAFDGAQP